MTEGQRLLLEEIRILREKVDKNEARRNKDNVDLRKEINSVKIKLAGFTSTISVVFGFIGAYAREVLFKK